MLLYCPGWVTITFVQWFCAARWKFGMLDLPGTADPLIAAAVRGKKKKEPKKPPQGLKIANELWRGRC